MAGYVQRGRDVAHLIKELGAEQGLIKAVIRLAEDNEMIRQEVVELSGMVERTIDIVSKQNVMTSDLQRRYTELRKKFYPDNEANPDQPWSSKR